MNSKSKIALSLALMVATYLATAVAQSPPGFNIRIRNNLPNGSDVKVHCKSSNEDLNAVTITLATPYTFQVSGDAVPFGIYLCDVDTSYGSRAFYLYDGERDQGRCDPSCLWSVSNNGIWGYPQDSEIPDILLNW